MRSSTWADEIRGSGNPYDHAEWHYLNYPLEPPSFPDKPSPDPANDVVVAVTRCEQVLTNASSSPEELAAHLSLLIHFVGDVHQPLHCTVLINNNYPPPNGDRGGNSFFVIANTSGVNLHSLWDKGLGGTVDPRVQYNDAIALSASHPRTNYLELVTHTNAGSWSKEGRAIAIQSVYLNGNLQGGTDAASAVALPNGYTANLKVVAERQGPLAGYRLADEIKKCRAAVMPANPVAVLSPVALNFGLVAVGSVSSKTFTLANVGGGQLVGTASVASPFKITNGSYSLRAGQSQVITVEFGPKASGDASGLVMFGGGGGMTAPVTGSGLAGPAGLRIISPP